jgi:starch synthase
LKILISTSEAVPYIKTGGLGDVAGTLATHFADAGHKVVMVLPLYQKVDKKKFGIRPVDVMKIQMGDALLSCRLWKNTTVKEKNLEVYFIEHNEFFDRDPIYHDGVDSYVDNGSRFSFFSKACLDVAIKLKFQPDIVHCSDWQTSLIPFFLKTWTWEKGFFDRTASVLTLHNLGYQGEADLSLGDFIGLNRLQVRSDEFESLGKLNFLKGGIFYADHVTTVSPKYAQEIMSEPGGSGLSMYLDRRRDDLTGILNGIDEVEWNPAIDKLIPANYTKDDLSGKAICKEKLQEYFHLDKNPDIPIFGLVGRMAYQKGLDLLQECIHNILKWDIQIVILGSGDPELQSTFGDLPKYYPGKVGSYIGFDAKLAHLIEAGSDFFVMPSRYEPCGLNQMFSLKYGTLPIVRATGGLYDTVENYHQPTQTGTGFLFDEPTSSALEGTIGWALHTWYNEKEAIQKMRVRAMEQDVSWQEALKRYEHVFEKALWRRDMW